MAFAVAVQAGDAKTSQAKDQAQPSCCSSKMKTSLETKEGTCPMSSGSCCKQKSSKQTTKTVAIRSPKDASKG